MGSKYFFLGLDLLRRNGDIFFRLSDSKKTFKLPSTMNPLMFTRFRGYDGYCIADGEVNGGVR
jgi:hypothetical protein